MRAVNRRWYTPLTMNTDLEREIRWLASDCTPAGVDDCVDGWRAYFASAGVGEEAQHREFNQIVRARFRSGVISIAAPELKVGVSGA